MEKQEENIFDIGKNDKIIELVDKIDFIKNITHTQESTIAGIEKNIDNYYESITQEEFVIISNYIQIVNNKFKEVTNTSS